MKTTPNRTLFAGADAGWYDLPADLLTARRGAQQLHQDYRDLRAPDSPHHDLVHAVVQAATTGKPLPKLKPLADHRAAVEEYQAHAAVLRDAVEQADRTVGAIANEMAYELVTDYLRPALDRLLSEARALLLDMPQTLTADALLAEGRDLGPAWRRLHEVCSGYAVIRRAYGSLPLDADVEHDLLGEYAEVKNRADLDPSVTRVHRNLAGSATPPWPDTEPHRLAWLLRNDAELWLPLPSERDVVWLAVNGNRLDAAARGRADAQYARSWAN